MPTIVRRVGVQGIEIMERAVDLPDGRAMAVCVFWSIEHARRDMYANGCYPEDGWKAIERDEEELEGLFDVLAELRGATLAYIEPAPGSPELSAVLRPADLIEMLRRATA